MCDLLVKYFLCVPVNLVVHKCYIDRYSETQTKIQNTFVGRRCVDFDVPWVL
jgi:hypothetical protein